MKTMKSKEFKHWLAKQGATFAPGKGSHLEKRNYRSHQKTAWTEIGVNYVEFSC